MYPLKQKYFELTNCVLDAMNEIFLASFRSSEGVVQTVGLRWNIVHSVLENSSATRHHITLNNYKKKIISCPE